MPTDVVMPQMGESIAEGTIVRWIKKVGDTVERDEPLFEISTDKVDAEIPSPVAGVVTEIRAKEGETVPINTVVAVIGPAGAQPAATAPAPQPATAPAPPAAAPPPPAATPQADGASSDAPSPAAAAIPAPAPAHGGDHPSTPGATEEARRQRSSPLVRRIAKEHNVDISEIRGTGGGGRVTKEDILAFVGGAAPPPAPPAAPQASGSGTVPASAARTPPEHQPVTRAGDTSSRPAPTTISSGAGLAGQTVPMSVMRRKIAERMVTSRQTSAHVHTVFEVNFHRVDKVRQARKAEYERAGAKLTYLSFILKAAIDALRAVPVVNASIVGDNVVYHEQINVGIAVALDWGLIVPVVKGADEKNLLGLSRAIVDLVNRARSKQLKPDEVSSGTFTITNPGSFGALFGMPIINQPQVAILGVGVIEKRPVVVDDAIAIRPLAYLSIGYDHRIIDGAVADEFMSHIKHTLETWDPNQA
ncbi:MAG: 2-oxoglutarate dehydrogenase, E2 component, dihydrolipoamide succinyltransferase [Luteitalea sp.]|nr:2-oxoglutarate dehydrogenase, E2 component, dihydrolipoamide succinyltransferase [Luteitalea sp.]